MDSQVAEIFLKRKDILSGLHVLGSSEEKFRSIREYIARHVGIIDQDVDVIIGTLYREYLRRWNNSKRMNERFLTANAEWLDQCIAIAGASSSNSGLRRGRPKKEFDSSSDRSKRRKTESLRRACSSSELYFATEMTMRGEGKKELANVLKSGTVLKISNEQALAVFTDAKLSKRKYNIIREPAKIVYPSYKSISAAKKLCYPPESYFDRSEVHCTVDLQEVLNHTASRLSKLFETEIISSAQKGCTRFRLYVKWGFDGTNMPEYNQKFEDPNSSDAHVVLTSFVPLRLFGEECLIWDNNFPSSTRYCRPIAMYLAKETPEKTTKEYERMIDAIKQLEAIELKLGEYVIFIEYELSMTMIDTKTINAITRTSSAQRCYLCKATSSNFNDIENIVKKPIETAYLKFGITSLHCWIRCFECLLHIAYRLSFCKWIKSGHMDEYNRNKNRIQTEFFSKLGLHVDKPRSGFGTSNTGNTARRFFENAEISSAITHIELSLIIRFRTLLKAISSGESIDSEKFQKYATDTARLYVQLYGWYHMPTSVHKLLIHGHSIIHEASVPIGKLSEEAQESMNKELRRMRNDNAWKGSREKTLRDVFCGLLVASDPIVTSFRHGTAKASRDLPEEVKSLLICDEKNQSKPEFEASDESDDS